MKTFAKRVFVAYYSPVAQVASLRVYGPDGLQQRVVARGLALRPGLLRYQLGVNAIVRTGARPVYAVRLLDAAGRVLHEQCVDEATAEQEAASTAQEVVFAFALPRPVKNARLRVRLPDGTLVEELQALPYLPAGNHQYRWKFLHLRPAGTAFVARLETADGQLLRERPVAVAAP